MNVVRATMRRGASPQRRRRRLLLAAAVLAVACQSGLTAGSAEAAAPKVVPPQPIPSIGPLDKPIIRPLVFLVESLDGTEQNRQQGADTTIVLETDVLFAFGSADLSAQARTRIDNVAGRLRATTGDVAVVGFTDSVGEDTVNLPLSHRRADAVAQALQERVSGLTVHTDGRGSADPVAPNSVNGQDNPAGRARNRRVEITFRG